MSFAYQSAQGVSAPKTIWGEECAICSEPWAFAENGEPINLSTMMVCRHGFHTECLLEWQTKGTNANGVPATCPLCRSDNTYQGLPGAAMHQQVHQRPSYDPLSFESVQQHPAIKAAMVNNPMAQEIFAAAMGMGMVDEMKRVEAMPASQRPRRPPVPPYVPMGELPNQQPQQQQPPKPASRSSKKKKKSASSKKK